MIDKDYLSSLLDEQRRMSNIADSSAGIDSYVANLGVDMRGLADFTRLYTVANLRLITDHDPLKEYLVYDETTVATIAAMMSRVFVLGVIAGRDRHHDPTKTKGEA